MENKICEQCGDGITVENSYREDFCSRQCWREFLQDCAVDAELDRQEETARLDPPPWYYR